MQDRIDLPLRAGRCLNVHGVESRRGGRFPSHEGKLPIDRTMVLEPRVKGVKRHADGDPNPETANRLR